MLVLGLLLTASCGRFGFPDQEMACGQPARFQVGATGITSLTATTTPSGFAVFTVAADKLVHGWSFDFEGDRLAESVQNVQLAPSPTSAIGVASNKSRLLVSAMYGSPATGTALLGLDTSLSMMRQGRYDGLLATTTPVATSGTGFAFVTVKAPASDVSVRTVTATGDEDGAPIKIVSGSEAPGGVSIIPTGTGYAVAYTAATPNPNQNRIELLDNTFAVVAGPMTCSSSALDPSSARIAWAPRSDTYLIAWSEKTSGGGDNLWIQLRGPMLEALTDPTLISNRGSSPQVTTDGSGFWMAWKDLTTTPSVLTAAHIGPDGTLVQRDVTNSGGTPIKWTMVERLDQPVLVWAEIAGNGPDLYFDPMCH